MKKRLFAGLFSLTLLGLVFYATNNGVAAQGNDNSNVGKYIVVLKDHIANPSEIAKEMAQNHGFSPEHIYEVALKGFSATIPNARLEKIKEDERVAFVSEDREVHTFVNGNGKGNGGNDTQTFAQTDPTGIRRINSLANPNKGTGIGVAVIDTGIDLKHPDLAANIVANKSCIRGKKNGADDNGHGSHVAGTIAGIDNSIGVLGVAPQAKLIAVKVLNSAGSGTWSSVICGVDYVTANTARYNIKVANMSLGGGGTSDNNCGNSNNDALHKAICKSRNAGVTYVVAAGNSGADANNIVPAAYDDAVITASALADSDGQLGGTGAVTNYGADDTFASFSNWGSVVDLGGPGVNILSTWKGGGYNTISGTSMATPHVAASAALYINSHPGSSWTQVRDGLKAAAEPIDSGHTDPSKNHPEPVVIATSL